MWNVRPILWGVALLMGGTALHAGEPCVRQRCESCESCPESVRCEESCRPPKSCGFRICLPSISWGVSWKCCDHNDCGHGCFSCCKKRRCCEKRPFLSEPPRAPLVFSVPAITVAQQAMAVNPVIPVQSAAISSQAVCQPKCQTNSEVDRLLFATLLKQLEAAEAQSAAPPKAPAAQSAKTISTEQRLSELEHRLDRILEALE